MNNDLRERVLKNQMEFTLWNAILLNHFKGDLIYSLYELDDSLYVKYAQSEHPAAKMIKQLLKSTSIFLHQINIEKSFSQSSIESKTDEDWKNIFNELVSALNTAQNQCNEVLKKSKGYLVLVDAIKYCKDSITLHVQAMERSQNKIQSYYVKYGDGLRKIISMPTTPTPKQ